MGRVVEIVFSLNQFHENFREIDFTKKCRYSFFWLYFFSGTQPITTKKAVAFAKKDKVGWILIHCSLLWELKTWKEFHYVWEFSICYMKFFMRLELVTIPKVNTNYVNFKMMIWHYFHWKKKRKSFKIMKKMPNEPFFFLEPNIILLYDYLDFPLNNTSSGRYLMSRYSNSGTRENHSKLSTWSKHSIQEVLQDPKMSYCLHQSRHKFCGDGILQAGEVSDLKE